LNDEAKLRMDLNEARSSCMMGSWLRLMPVLFAMSSTAYWARLNERHAMYTLAPAHSVCKKWNKQTV